MATTFALNQKIGYTKNNSFQHNWHKIYVVWIYPLSPANLTFSIGWVFLTLWAKMRHRCALARTILMVEYISSAYRHIWEKSFKEYFLFLLPRTNLFFFVTTRFSDRRAWPVISFYIFRAVAACLINLRNISELYVFSRTCRNFTLKVKTVIVYNHGSTAFGGVLYITGFS